jgi:hypothetical protein
MPFKSKAQQLAKEFAEKTINFKRLPEHVKANKSHKKK